MTQERYPTDAYYNNSYIRGHVDGQILRMQDAGTLLHDIPFTKLDSWFRYSLIKEAKDAYKLTFPDQKTLTDPS